jgi:hypothetical protein
MQEKTLGTGHWQCHVTTQISTTFHYAPTLTMDDVPTEPLGCMCSKNKNQHPEAIETDGKRKI